MLITGYVFMTGIEIRKAKIQDLDILFDVIHRAYRTKDSWTGEAHLVKGIRISMEDLKELIINSKDVLFVAGNLVLLGKR